MSITENETWMQPNRRQLLKSAAVLLVSAWANAQGAGFAQIQPPALTRKIIVVACGGMRRSDTFSATGAQNIPHLYRDLLPQSVFYPLVQNAGVTSHFNTISSILTGQWQRLDDWGKTAPVSPTFFERARKQYKLGQEQAWLISSNKALSSKIGASSVREYGAAYGANVVFPKQLLINAVVRAAAGGRPVQSTDRSSVQPEIEAMLSRDNFDGLGWSVFGDNSVLEPKTLGAIEGAIAELVRTNAPATGDEFTYLVSREVMRRFAPSLLVVTFSDMEVAHFGSYAMHLAGIRTVDRLVYELWNEVQTQPAYKDKTTLFVLPEFGRDADGSSTNGFFNHRQNDPSTRMTWMMCLGEAARKAQIIEQPAAHTSVYAAISRLLDLEKSGDASQPPLAGLSL
jgi:hypothetical protein